MNQRIARFLAIVPLMLMGFPNSSLGQLPPPKDGPPRIAMNFQGPVGRTTSMAFSPDSARLAIGSFGKTVELWDIGWNRPQLGPGTDNVTHVSTLRWEIARGTRGAINTLAFAPDGLLAVAGLQARGQTGDIILFDESTGQVVQALPPQRDQQSNPGHKFAVISLAFSSDGNYLLSADDGGAVWLWTRAAPLWTGRQIQPAAGSVSLADKFMPVAFLDNTTALLSRVAANGTFGLDLVQLSNLGNRTSVVSGQAKPITTIAVGPNGRWAYGSGVDGADIQAFSGNRPAFLVPGVPGETVRTLTWTPQGLLVATSGVFQGKTPRGSVARLIDPQGRILDEAKITQSSVCATAAITPDGRRFVTHDDETASVMLFELLDGSNQSIAKPFSAGPTRQFGGTCDAVTNVQWVDNQTLALQLHSDSGLHRKFDIQSLDLSGPEPPIPADFDPKSVSVLSEGTQDDAIGRPEREVLNVRYKRQRATALLDLRLQNAFSGAAAVIEDPRSGRIAVAIGTKGSGGIFVYDITPGRANPAQLLRHYRDHSGEVVSLDVSPDGKMLVSSSIDQTVKIWPLDGLFAEGSFPGESAWGMTLAPQENRIVGIEPSGIAVNRGMQEGDVISRVQTQRGAQYIDERDPGRIRTLLSDRNTLTESYLIDVIRGGQLIPAAQVVVPAWEPLVSLVVSGSGDWVIFTPSPNSLYAASLVNGTNLFGWQVNRGENYTPRFVIADDLQKQFEQPDAIRQIFALRQRQVVAQADPLDNAIQALPQIEIVRPKRGDVFAEGAPIDVEAIVTGAAAQTMDVTGTNGGRTIEIVSDQWLGDRRRVLFRTSAIDDLNRIMVTATEGPNVTSTLHTTAEVLVRTQKPITPPDPETDAYDVHIIGVGVSDYGGVWPDLPAATKDVAGIIGALESCVGQGPIRKVHVRKLLDEDVSLESLKQTIDETVSSIDKTRNKDLLLICVSGHGDALGEKSEYRFIPPTLQKLLDDKTSEGGIPWEVFADAHRAPCRVVWLLDTCFSGAAIGDALKSVVRSGQQGGRIVVTASSATQEALESKTYRGGHGAFTASILDGVEGLADGFFESPGGNVKSSDSRKDGQISVYELGSFVRDRTYNFYTKRDQEPRMSPGQREDKPEDFVIRSVSE